ncbi:MAG: PAS domain-containing protein [Desulfobacterales bacterium]
MSRNPTYDELKQRVDELEKDAAMRKRFEKALLESEEKHRFLIKNLPSIVYKGYKDWSVEFFDRKIELLTGYDVDEFNSGRIKWSDIIDKEDIETARESFIQALKTDKSYVREYRIKSKAGNIHWIQERGQIVCDNKGNIAYVNGVFFDITERKVTEEHIHALTQQLMKAHENERQMISRELHDRIGQDLSMLKIGCDTLFDGHPEVHPGVRQRISELTKILHGSIMAVRDLAYDLRPPSLDQLGLAKTIFQYCEDFSEKTGLSVDFKAAGMDDLRLDFDTETNLYRLVQEGLININKHADARQATIRLVASFPNIILRIEDDGQGFNVEDRLVAVSNEKRMGLRSMGERVGLLGGKMRIHSRPTEGTKIFIEVPFQKKNDR